MGPHRAHHGPGAVGVQGQGGDVILGKAVGELLLPGGKVDCHIRGAVGPLGGQGKAAVGAMAPAKMSCSVELSRWSWVPETTM